MALEQSVASSGLRQEALGRAMSQAVARGRAPANLAALCEDCARADGSVRRAGALVLDVEEWVRREAPAGLNPWMPRSLSALDCAVAFNDPQAALATLAAMPLGSLDGACAASALALGLRSGAFDAVHALALAPGFTEAAFGPESIVHGVNVWSLALDQATLASPGAVLALREVARGPGAREALLSREDWLGRLASETWLGAPRGPLLEAWSKEVKDAGPRGWEAALGMAHLAFEMGASWRMEWAALSAFDAPWPQARGVERPAWSEPARLAPMGALAVCASMASSARADSRWRESARRRAPAKLAKLPPCAVGGIEGAWARAVEGELRVAAKGALTGGAGPRRI
jgi:hypothetical protein